MGVRDIFCCLRCLFPAKASYAELPAPAPAVIGQQAPPPREPSGNEGDSLDAGSSRRAKAQILEKLPAMGASIRLLRSKMSCNDLREVMEAIEALPDVVELECGCLGIGDDGAEVVADVLGTGDLVHRLTSLSLWGNGITDAGCSKLCKTLKERGAENLTSLVLSNNDIADGGVQACAELLATGKVPLRSLDLSVNADVANTAVSSFSRKMMGVPNVSLVSLNLSNNSIGDPGALSLAEWMASSSASCVRELDLSFNFVGNQGVLAFERIGLRTRVDTNGCLEVNRCLE